MNNQEHSSVVQDLNGFVCFEDWSELRSYVSEYAQGQSDHGLSSRELEKEFEDNYPHLRRGTSDIYFHRSNKVVFFSVFTWFVFYVDLQRRTLDDVLAQAVTLRERLERAAAVRPRRASVK